MTKPEHCAHRQILPERTEVRTVVVNGGETAKVREPIFRCPRCGLTGPRETFDPDPALDAELRRNHWTRSPGG